MYKRRYMFIGAALIVLGLLALISSWIGVDFCALALPLLLIAAGISIILRPRFAPPGAAMHIRLLGNIRRTGAWATGDEEIWVLVGDLKLIVPDTAPVAITSVAFLTTSRVFGARKDTFLEPFETATEGYAMAESKLRFENWRFVTGVKVRRPES